MPALTILSIVGLFFAVKRSSLRRALPVLIAAFAGGLDAVKAARTASATAGAILASSAISSSVRLTR